MFSPILFKLIVIDFDLEAGYDYLLAEYDFIDGNRTVALGSSYGGYLVPLAL
jgi:dipeptidyl aminopeptidase/acylaminoacyl peptidase